MSFYKLKIDSDSLNPFSEIGDRELTLWQGVKNKSLKSRHITDGNFLVDKKHVVDEEEEFFEKLCDRKDDVNIENEKIKSLVFDLKSEDQVEGYIQGQQKNPPGFGTMKPKWIAFIKFDGEHCLAPAVKVAMAQRLVGKNADLKVGDSEILTWWKYDVPVAAVSTWKFFDVETE